MAKGLAFPAACPLLTDQFCAETISAIGPSVPDLMVAITTSANLLELSTGYRLKMDYSTFNNAITFIKGGITETQLAAATKTVNIGDLLYFQAAYTGAGVGLSGLVNGSLFISAFVVTGSPSYLPYGAYGMFSSYDSILPVTGSIRSFSGSGKQVGVAMNPIINGAYQGVLATSRANKHYVLETTFGARKYSRYNKIYRTLLGQIEGGQVLDSLADITFTIYEIDLSNIQNPTAYQFSQIVYKATYQASMPAFALYVIVNTVDMQITLTYTQIAQLPQGLLKVRSLYGNQTVDPLTGQVTFDELQVNRLPVNPPGPEEHYPLGFGLQQTVATLSSDSTGEVQQLRFYVDNIPDVGARIRLRTWESGHAIGRTRNTDSIATEGKIPGDDGVRSQIVTDLSPLPRTSADCEYAGGAFLLDRRRTQYNGSYNFPDEYWAGFTFSGGLSFSGNIGIAGGIVDPDLCSLTVSGGIVPGRIFNINSPLRNINYRNFIINQVQMTPDTPYIKGRLLYTIQFGPDLILQKMLPKFVESTTNLLLPQDLANTPVIQDINDIGSTYLPNLENATGGENITGTSILIDAGETPLYQIEIRRADKGWGRNDQNRLALYMAQTITLTRTAFEQVFYMRYVQGSYPNAITSRYTTAIRVVYPLVPLAPQGTLDVSDPLHPTLNLNTGIQDIRNICGLEVRDSDNVTVLEQIRFTSITDLIYVYDNSVLQRTSVAFFCYFFNLMWEYSPVFELSNDNLPFPCNFSDNFERSDISDLGPNWTFAGMAGSWSVTSEKLQFQGTALLVEAGVFDGGGAPYTDEAQQSSLTFLSVSGRDSGAFESGPAIHTDTNAGTGYGVVYTVGTAGPDTIEFVSLTNFQSGTPTAVAYLGDNLDIGNVGLNPGDILSIESEVAGEQLTLTARVNGVSIGSINVPRIAGRPGVVGDIGIVSSLSGIFPDLDTMLVAEEAFLASKVQSAAQHNKQASIDAQNQVGADLATTMNDYETAKADLTATKAHLDKAEQVLNAIDTNFKNFGTQVNWSFTNAGVSDIDHLVQTLIASIEPDRSSLPDGPVVGPMTMIWSAWAAQDCRSTNGTVDPNTGNQGSSGPGTLQTILLPKIYESDDNVLYAMSVSQSSLPSPKSVTNVFITNSNTLYDMSVINAVPAGDRITVCFTTASLANGAVENGIVIMARTFAVVGATVSVAARVELYETSASRTADASRSQTVPPTPGTQHGVIMDLYLDTMDKFTWIMSPPAEGANYDSPATSSIYYAVTNISGSTQAITVCITFTSEEE